MIPKNQGATVDLDCIKPHRLRLRLLTPHSSLLNFYIEISTVTLFILSRHLIISARDS